MKLSKKFIFLIFILAVVSYALFSRSNYGTSENDQGKNKPTLFEKAKAWLNKDEPKREKELEQLKEELTAKEALLAKMDEDIPKIMADAANARPACPGGSVTVRIEKDPRDELREEIRILKEKIAALENQQ